MLLYRGKKLEDANTIGFYNIRDQDNITAIMDNVSKTRSVDEGDHEDTYISRRVESAFTTKYDDQELLERNSDYISTSNGVESKKSASILEVMIKQQEALTSLAQEMQKGNDKNFISISKFHNSDINATDLLSIRISYYSE